MRLYFISVYFFFFHWLMPFCFGFGFKFHRSGKIRVNSNLIEFGSTSNQNPTWINHGVWKRKMWQRIVLLNCMSRAFDKVVNRENGHNCICRCSITLNTYFRAIYHQVFTFILRQKLWKNEYFAQPATRKLPVWGFSCPLFGLFSQCTT